MYSFNFFSLKSQQRLQRRLNKYYPLKKQQQQQTKQENIIESKMPNIHAVVLPVSIDIVCLLWPYSAVIAHSYRYDSTHLRYFYMIRSNKTNVFYSKGKSP